jgi:hypothetical protein
VRSPNSKARGATLDDWRKLALALERQNTRLLRELEKAVAALKRAKARK